MSSPSCLKDATLLGFVPMIVLVHPDNYWAPNKYTSGTPIIT